VIQNEYVLAGLTLLWLLAVGPLWLVGWGAMWIARRVHIIASAWCRFCLWLYP
jgi:hypothetical protein